jgi:hypothetical protein
MQYRPQTVQTTNFEEAMDLDAKGPAHKGLIYLEYHSVSPLVRIGIPPPPQPLSRKRVCPLQRNQRGETHSPADEGWGSLSSEN